MQQLLKITTTNVEVKLNTQNAELRQKTKQPSANVKTTQGELQVKQNTPAKINLDTYNARKVLGFSNARDIVYENAQKGKQNALEYMAQSTQTLRKLGDVHEGIDISKIISNRLLGQQQIPSATIIASPGTDISVEPHVYETEYVPGNVSYDWNISSPEFDYVPGGVSMEVVQKPSVQIEYVGKPLYFPRSYAEQFE